MYGSINKNLINYIKFTKDGLSHTIDMPEELNVLFEETKKRMDFHDLMVENFKKMR